MKRKYIILLSVISILVLLQLSCDPFFNCLEGNGRLISENRTTSEFSGVRSNSSFIIRITKDAVFSIEVTADENLINSIRTTVSDGDLVVDTKRDRCIQSDDNILINIHMPSIDRVDQNGSGYIDVSDFDCTNLEVGNTDSGDIDIGVIHSNSVDIDLTGSGSVNISGTANSGEYTVTGSGRINADDLRVNECNAKISGSGNVYCYVSDLLDITITGSGNVYYLGSPALSQHITGSGEVIKRN
jgi:hypothetical protein